MNDKFDELAKGLAQSVTRRAALKKCGVGLASVVLVAGSVQCQAQAGQSPQFSAWSAPVNLGPSINTTSNEWHAAISGDALSIFFVSDRPGGLGGFDLWTAQRATRNADWEPAQNLGPGLNTSNDEYTPELSPDGHGLFFSSLGLSSDKHLQICAGFRNDTADNLG